MTFVEAIILGIIQGLTEFLPVSSSGHLVIAHWLFGWQTEGDLAFDVALHVGTLAAVLVYFWRDFVAIAGALLLAIRTRDFSDPLARVALWIGLGTVPAAIAGLLLENAAETAFRDPVRVAIMLIVVSLVMLVAEKVATKQRDERSITWIDGLVIGIAQAIAIIPGVSRSGITISAGLFRGLKRESAARFSFLLATPVVAAAALLQFRKVASGSIVFGDPLIVLTGMVVSGVVGVFCIAFLLRFLARRSLALFIGYRIGLGVLVLVIAAMRG